MPNQIIKNNNDSSERGTKNPHSLPLFVFINKNTKIATSPITNQ